MSDPEDDLPIAAEPPKDDTPKWSPDEQLLPALLAGSESIRYKELARGDRAWAIAGLRLAGVTAEAIAKQLDCSLRQVRAVAAEPAAILARFYMLESDAFEATLRLHLGDIARLAHALDETARERDRYRDQLRRLLDSAMTGELGPTFPKCGHPKTKYNTYRAPKTGKLNCRMCHAEAQADYVARCRARDEREAVTTGVHTGDYGEVAQLITDTIERVTGRARSGPRSGGSAR